MKPATSTRIFTPTSTAPPSVLVRFVGAALGANSVHGHVCGVAVAVGVTTAVFVGVGVAVGPNGEVGVSADQMYDPLSRMSAAFGVLSIDVAPVPSSNCQLLTS